MANFVQWELNVSGCKAEHVTRLFEQAGAVSVTITCADEEEIFDAATPQQNAWNNQVLSALFVTPPAERVLEIGLRNVLGDLPPLTISEIQDQDWKNKWREDLKPIKAGNNLWICPSQCKPVVPTDTNIIIDPGMAFGTGNHATTLLCLQRISECNMQGKQVIDWGCGTGVLGIAAGMLGASSVIGVDIDAIAVSVASANVDKNGVNKNVSIHHNDEIDLGENNIKSDLLVANILFNTIMDLKSDLLSLCGSNTELLLSGILENQCDAVIEHYGDYFIFEKRTRNNWALLIGSLI